MSIYGGVASATSLSVDSAIDEGGDAMKRSKKRSIALGIAGVVLFGLLYATGSLGRTEAPAGPWREDRVQGSGPDKIAVVEVEGEIVSSVDGLIEDVAAAEEITSQLRQARRDDAVKAVVLRVNTPGGSVVASEEILGEISELRDEGKPIVTSMREVAASGGYLISTGTSRIVAHPSTLTGSIGAIMVLLNVEEAAGKLGIEPIVIKSGRFKDVGSPFREMSRRERRMLQRVIDQAYQRFVDAVASGRDLSRDEILDVADGRVLTGTDAQAAGLLDELGNLDDAIAAARELADLEQARVVEYQAPFSLTDLFRGVGIRLGIIDDVRRSIGNIGPVVKYMYVP